MGNKTTIIESVNYQYVIYTRETSQEIIERRLREYADIYNIKPNDDITFELNPFNLK